MTVYNRLHSNRLLAPEALAGWIFADILLVLFIVGLGATANPRPAPTPSPSSSPRPTTKPKVTSPKPPSTKSLKPRPVSVTVTFDPDDVLGSGPAARAQMNKICRQLKAKLAPVRKDQAALVLIFGGGPNTEIGLAQSRAARIGTRLSRCKNQTVFRKSVVFEDYWDGELRRGKARLKVFLFTASK